ncbi:TPA: nitronate monooxygenase [Listeria monocytogenes]|uniref:nitronate monooxygenase n=1 Tax=Listeria monocytogenes TaxID=1639 RepID=UPI00076674FE|nr:nitronate monooxygenase [Listeria monocytogenes]EAC4466080.1 enoyl-[acyl-carrier-protein] reductase FabK [Listeria monocytogenes]EAD2416468.1 enoyl-[acyl-carrier-protein] reductase FabK [Listeria monocytogenes]EAD5990004.1 enoyl-[acyl-carrier-protein] reductase FabK [Listeria monocytogenes]EAD6054163.1 enoyl-[acyl-carrier-protein] reductase FabK [Listeria monocytogenes]EAD6185500.1 enoyl-[acyl-carrier-protein] reductase FabK [Listeria monocytogenes]
MSITNLLNIKYPIIQGAMAQIAKAPLVAAVSNAGGLGIIASGGMTADMLREEIKKTKALTDKPFGVNLMLMMTNIAELTEVIIEEKVGIVTTGAGTPKTFMPIWKEAGIIVISVVPSVMIAKRMEKMGADAVIAEGTEAGGHVGETTTMALLPQIVDAVTIPVIGAGGIADGRGIVAALALGAKGVQIGTRFLATDECPVHPDFKAAVIKASDRDTMVTGRKAGAPVRSIKNKMIKEYIRLEEENADRDTLEELTLGSLRKAVQEGDTDNGSVMAGQIAGLITEIKPCKDVIEEMMTDAKNVIAGLELN